MHRLKIIILFLEIVLSILVITLKDKIIIGNYNQYSQIYEIISEERQLPKNSNIKYIIKNRFVFRDAMYTVFYKTDKMHSTTVSIELDSTNIEKIDSYSISTWIYCVIIIVFTYLILHITESYIIKRNK